MIDEKNLRWYIIQTYSGSENAAKQNIENKVKSLGLENYIPEVFVANITKIERKKNGQLKEVVKNKYPGYVFIRMVVTDETWFQVRNTQLVTGILGSSGSGAKPVPVPEEDMRIILKECGAITAPTFKGNPGDEVKVLSGAFAGSSGIIESIDEQKQIVVVLIEAFGRQTPAEVNFADIELKETQTA